MCLQSLMEFHYCLFKILRKNQNVMDKELQREITQTELAPSPYFSMFTCGYQSVCQILWTSVTAFSRYWKSKTSQTDELTHGLTDNVKTVYPAPSSQTQFARGGGMRLNWILTFWPGNPLEAMNLFKKVYSILNSRAERKIMPASTACSNPQYLKNPKNSLTSEKLQQLS